jgi:hypothetical protein
MQSIDYQLHLASLGKRHPIFDVRIIYTLFASLEKRHSMQSIDYQSLFA